jgi:hypothetical protein
MLDNEIELGEIGGGVIDVMDIESVCAQRVYGRPLMHVNVFVERYCGSSGRTGSRGVAVVRGRQDRRRSDDSGPQARWSGSGSARRFLRGLTAPPRGSAPAPYSRSWLYRPDREWIASSAEPPRHRKGPVDPEHQGHTR